ncbi:MAG: SpoIID/LytB domain-containing protein [Duncaniella sp.]|nr:SpoIID/LytB domain-containing protein [Duncaniella sp.]
MNKQPNVRVGILSSPCIRFTLTGLYSGPDGVLTEGYHEAKINDSGISFTFDGKTYTSVEFSPNSYAGDTFELEGVTIGVDFHWQRKENQRFRGSLRIIVEDGKLMAINIIDVEDYLVSVISSEMKSTSSLSLLRAHAVISRSWVLSMMSQGESPSRSTMNNPNVSALNPGPSLIKYWDREDHRNFDVCADDHCQRYQGINRVSTTVAEGAVNDTCGEVLTYKGKLCDTRFSKCCGGVFEQFETCWDDTPRPYLKAGRDAADRLDYPDLTDEENARQWILNTPEAFCNTTDKTVLSQVMNGYDMETPDFYRWTVQLSQEKISSLLATRLNTDFGAIRALVPLTRGTSGRIRELKIIGSKCELTIGKELLIRRALSDTHLYSSAFVVEPHGLNADGVPSGFTLHGAGWGHGAGLCQIGAAIMGERGYSYDEILRHYYADASITKLY